MSDIKYNKLKILIADDFSNFRSTVNGMLGKLGVIHVDLASNGEEVLNHCQRGSYDVILCDYDLGVGRNGQQVLEELRYKSIITRRSAFIIVSAETSKDVVMAAYDCEPDDYLMKPITAKMLQQRMTRLLLQRQAFGQVYAAVESNLTGRAIGMLVDMSIAEGRYAVAAQKLLGEMFITEGEFNKAEKLYTKALQSRQLDWARLGLARVKQLKGELDVAGDWLERIVDENPLYLPAYDSLAENWQQLGDLGRVQTTVQRSVDISPKSILRQKKLAEVAEKNGDLTTALSAIKSTVKLGALSCHASAEDSLSLVRVASKSVEKKLVNPEPLMAEIIETLDVARERFPFTKDQSVRAEFLEGRALALAGHHNRSKTKLSDAESSVKRMDHVSLEVQLDRLAALQSAGETAAAEKLVAELVDAYEFDQEALELLDALLAEPVSESNQALIASVNREGIDLYNQERFDEAIECFEKVRRIFPKHVGVQLNIVQSLIGKLRSGTRDDHTTQRAEESLAIIGSLVAPGHAQYARFERLKAMAFSSMAER